MICWSFCEQTSENGSKTNEKKCRKKGIEKVVEIEGRKVWREWILTVVAPNCITFERCSSLLAEVILRGRVLLRKSFSRLALFDVSSLTCVR